MNRNLRRLIRVVTADKKKLSIMMALMAVGLLMWGRLLLKNVPRSAVADDKNPVAHSGAAGIGGPSVKRPRVVVDLPTQVDRDLFAPHPLLLPAVIDRVVPAVGPEKSRPDSADGVDRAEVVRRASLGLQLQTTMLGDHPQALINGVLVSPGQKVQGFELIEVRPRGVVLEMAGIRLNLEM